MKLSSVVSVMTQLKKQNKDKDYTYFYRGHSSKTYKLIPSIYRNVGLVKNESVLFRDLIAHYPKDFENSTFTIDFLVKMQHYSLPTRLLDITTNPLIALYFAACSNPKEHGELIVFKIPNEAIKYYDSDTVSVLANIAKRPYDFSFDISKGEKEFNKDDDIPLLLHDIGQEKPHFKPVINPSDLNSVLCVKVKKDNNRIINQSGAFLLYGIKGNNKELADIDSSWLINKSDNERLFIKDKTQILEDLDLIGINDSYIYPQLDSYSKLLNNKYQE